MIWGPYRKPVNICRSVDRQLQENTPNESAVELNSRNSRIPVFVQYRANVKHRQYASDGQVHRPKSEVPAGTDPAGIHVSTTVHDRGRCVERYPLTSFRPRKLVPRDQTPVGQSSHP